MPTTLVYWDIRTLSETIARITMDGIPTSCAGNRLCYLGKHFEFTGEREIVFKVDGRVSVIDYVESEWGAT